MQNSKSPLDLKNIRYFIAFKVFFNSRFYYPVFTILFLDFGLTLGQFALLHVAWTVGICLTWLGLPYMLPNVFIFTNINELYIHWIRAVRYGV